MGLHGLLGLLFLTGLAGAGSSQRGGDSEGSALTVEFIEIDRTSHTQANGGAVPSGVPDSELLDGDAKESTDQPADAENPLISTLSEEGLPEAPDASDRERRARAGEPHVSLSTLLPDVTAPALATGAPAAGEIDGGNASVDLRTAYLAALKAAINKQRWALGGRQGNCTLTITQTAGGLVGSALSNDCGMPRADRLALEAAALMAQPLPYAGYETVFSPTIDLTF